MALITAFFTYLVKFIFFIAVAVAGFVAGKKFKASKTQKNSASEE
jgi:uncharacterized membrane protein